MPNTYQRILIHPDAASKPTPGAPCNGCGVCCLLEPCPLGIVLSRRRHGACVALRWHDDVHQYRCGALTDPTEVLQEVLPKSLSRLAPWLSVGVAPVLRRQAKRWIAAGQGCDSSVELQVPQEPPATAENSPTISEAPSPGAI